MDSSQGSTRYHLSSLACERVNAEFRIGKELEKFHVLPVLKIGITDWERWRTCQNLKTTYLVRLPHLIFKDAIVSHFFLQVQQIGELGPWPQTSPSSSYSSSSSSLSPATAGSNSTTGGWRMWILLPGWESNNWLKKTGSDYLILRRRF